MAQTINDNFQNNSPKSLDNKYLNSGISNYSSVAAANTAIVPAYRHLGLTVKIGSQEYWYRDGTADGNLIPKISSFVAFAEYATASNTAADPIELTEDVDNVLPISSLNLQSGGFSVASNEISVPGAGVYWFSITFSAFNENTNPGPLAVAIQQSSGGGPYQNSLDSYFYHIIPANGNSVDNIYVGHQEGSVLLLSEPSKVRFVFKPEITGIHLSGYNGGLANTTMYSILIQKIDT